MELSVYNIKGEKTERNVILNDDIFNTIPNDHAIYLDVKQFLANKRQGTHKSKERGEIAGSSKKLHKQKGTGGARRGNVKSPLLKGGGRVFGPRPRDYSFKLNKQVKHLARVSALTYKAKNNSITVIEDFSFESPKTKKYSEILNNLGQTGKKTLLVLPKNDKNISLSAKNIQRAKITVVSNLNTYDIMNANNLLLPESSVKELENQVLKNIC